MNTRWNEAIALLREIRDAVTSKQCTVPIEISAVTPKPDADGWIPWAGGECPVDRGALASIELRDGYRADARDPSAFRWDHDGSNGDIIAYKLAEQTKERRPEAVAEPDWTPPPWSECPEDAEWMVLCKDGDWVASVYKPDLDGDEYWSFPVPIGRPSGYTDIRKTGHTPPRHIWQSSRMRRPEGV